MKVTVLGSSSAGNCYVLKSETGSLLLEAGIPFAKLQKGLNYDLSHVVGCLITHEHKDHSKAANEVMRAGIDVYTSLGTAKASDMCGHRLNFIKSQEDFCITDFDIMPFETEHDSAEPLGFLIRYRPTGETLLFATDTYYLRNRFSGLNYIMVECNYCKDILDANIAAGSIDESRAKRLLSSHFSLEHVKEFLQANHLSECRKIMLLHLSGDNSNAARMHWEIVGATGIETVIAYPGLEVDFDLYPY